MLEADIVWGAGLTFSLGLTFDLGDLMDSGVFGQLGFENGFNLGYGIGLGYAGRGIDGLGKSIDANLGLFSPTLIGDLSGWHGGAVSVGPGGGISAGGSLTGTISIGDMLDSWGRSFDQGDFSPSFP